MELNFKTTDYAEVLFFPVLANEQAITDLIKSLKYEDEASVLNQVKKEKFQAKKGQQLIIHDAEQTIVLIGTGKKKLSTEDWRLVAGQAVSYLRKYSASSIGIIAKDWLKGNADVFALGQALAEGLSLASYTFSKYKKVDKDKVKVNIQELVVELAKSRTKRFKFGWDKGMLLATGTVKARDLVNEPAGVMTPSFLAKQAEQIAKDNKKVSVKILDKAQIKKLGMNAYLAVDQGSNQDPKFIHLVYRGGKDKIALVGKGVTFDSGGLNIKIGDSMKQMKIDMAGAATVLGVFSVISQLQPKLEVHGIIAACENMPSGKALKPGDIVKNMQGKSIEIGDTDAEGRVTLADSLAYAQKQGINKIVDLATLTGAVMVALGPNYAGLFSNNNKLGNELLKQAEVSGERLWKLPLAPEYIEFNKSSQIADIANIPNTRYGGAITAALFLQEFIEDKTVWAHIDLGGPAYAEKPFNSYISSGGVGYGVRTLLNWLVK